jgi:hypothetical protein
MRALICLTAISLIGCSGLPPFPSVEIKLVDTKHGKIHRYELPKRRGEDAKYLGSINLTFANLEKNFAIAPKEYSKLEQYISAVEDVAERRCK